MANLLITNRNFRHLWAGQLISALGDRLTQMGILAFVMVSARDKGDTVALITFFSLLPFLLFGPLFGALVDRLSRKKVMIFADGARAALVILIPVIWINTHSAPLIVAWFFLLGSLTALFTPAKMSIIATITEKKTLLEANSMIVTTGMVATLVGTLLAGAVIKAVGVQLAFHVNAVTYILSGCFIFMIAAPKPSIPQAPATHMYATLAGDIKIGIAYIKRHRIILNLILLSSVFSFISSFTYILVLNYSSTTLGLGPFGMGCVLSAAGFGMIAGTLILLKRKDKVKYDRALYVSFFLVGAFSLLFILRPNLYLSLLFLFCAGMGAAIATVSLDTIFQRVSPDDLKGKIFAARGLLSNSVFLLSLLGVGFLIKHVETSVLFGAVGAVGVVTALRIFLDERLWGYQLLRLTMRTLMNLFFGFRSSGLENLPKTRRVILAGNHTSVLDGIALTCAYPGRIFFLVADTSFNAKFFGWCMKRLGYLPVHRGGFNKETIRDAVGLLKAGYAIGIFPEGKIAADGRLAEGREGVALLARLGNADIIPFAIEGAFEAWPVTAKYPKRFPVSVKFGSPLETKEYALREELVSETMKDIARLKLDLEREGYLLVDPDEIVKHLINI